MIPNLSTKQRNALDMLNRAEWINRGEFSGKRIGEKTIEALVSLGLAEEIPSNSRIARYKITEEGRDEALRKPAEALKQSAGLTMVQPLVSAVPPLLEPKD